jgi:exonuclease III
LTFENGDCKGKGLFSTHLTKKSYNKVNKENQISYKLFFDFLQYLTNIKWNQNFKNSFFKHKTQIENYNNHFEYSLINLSITIFSKFVAHLSIKTSKTYIFVHYIFLLTPKRIQLCLSLNISINIAKKQTLSQQAFLHLHSNDHYGHYGPVLVLERQVLFLFKVEAISYKKGCIFYKPIYVKTSHGIKYLYSSLIWNFPSALNLNKTFFLFYEHHLLSELQHWRCPCSGIIHIKGLTSPRSNDSYKSTTTDSPTENFWNLWRRRGRCPSNRREPPPRMSTTTPTSTRTPGRKEDIKDTNFRQNFLAYFFLKYLDYFLKDSRYFDLKICDFCEIIYSLSTHAFSMKNVNNHCLKYMYKTFKNIFRLSLELSKGTVYRIRNQMKPMNHCTFNKSVCGLKSCRFSHNSSFSHKKENTTFFLRNFTIPFRCLVNARLIWSHVKAKLQYDIEKNPGPVSGSIFVVTLNCRGLNKIDKFRLLLSKVLSLQNRNSNTIFMLQETMILETKYLDLAWKGKYIFTPGTGNSKGCITLLHNDIQINHKSNIGNRGHYAHLELSNHKQVTIFNIYAPNGYNQEKRDFFENLITLINNFNINDIILAGDFNLTLQVCDRYNRQTSAGENNIANYLKTELEQVGFTDHLEYNNLMTWKKGNSMSKLDRIFSRLHGYRLHSITTDWTLCDTDHAAVIAKFECNRRLKRGVKPCRLSSEVVNNQESLSELSQYLREQLQTLNPESDPHLILEFTKMTIRTKAIEIGKRQANAEEDYLKFINEDIKAHENLLLNTHEPDQQTEINLTIQLRINEKNEILDKQGKRLALRARSKWYNEGEKSNKYFLNLLKSRASRNEMTCLNIEGNNVTNSEIIDQEVNSYYQKLYNNGTTIVESNDFLNEMFVVDQETSNIVNKPITISELWSALKPLKDTAPGPDGISHLYLKRLWHIVGPIILNAWNYSIQINKMPPSHYSSFLKLIPKPGKDPNQLKNWRPITLSNCDHKLITRIYNNRLLQIISDKISLTQTAYIRTRNITDNIRMVNSAIQLARYEPQINGTVIALDAQKAFDTVSHEYLKRVLSKIGLSSFNPIFELLYRGIKNDLILNGEIKGRHYINNGVKQGDALSCTLFLLAMEPLIRNVQKNANIKPIKSLSLPYEWPKIYGYADDITCVMNNDAESKQALFDEYGVFTKVSGLYLNADKTEIFHFGTPNVLNVGPIVSNIKYLNRYYSVTSVPELKMNGILLCENFRRFKEINVRALINKMDNHFQQWSKRNLSLLGRIQIYKTFGLSQFLYHLSILEPSSEMWKLIEKKINKFLWNRSYIGNLAPYRIKKTVVNTPVHRGGFGMVDIRQVTAALRLRRHFILIEQDVHPLHHFINRLVKADEYLNTSMELEIDEVVKANLNALKSKRLKDCQSPDWQLESDLILQTNLLSTRIENIVRPRKINSRDYHQLKRLGFVTLRDVLLAQRSNITKLVGISLKELKQVLSIMARANYAWPVTIPSNKLRDTNGSWIETKTLSSKRIREIIFGSFELMKPKISIMEEDQMVRFYSKIAKLISIPNKTKMLRLLHGDVYTAERRVRFGLAESDICRRCFLKETIFHLLAECPYSLEVYKLLGIANSNTDANANANINELLGINLNINSLEVRTEIIISLVFRLHNIPPEVLVKTTFEKYAKGLANKQKIKLYAERQLTN